MSECITCGFPVWRRGSHAEWCADIARLNATPPNWRAPGVLTGCDAEAIRAAFSVGRRPVDLASKYAVSVSTIRRAINRQGAYAEASCMTTFGASLRSGGLAPADSTQEVARP